MLKIWMDITRNALHLVGNEENSASAAGNPSPSVKPVARLCTSRVTPANNTINNNNDKNISKLPSQDLNKTANTVLKYILQIAQNAMTQDLYRVADFVRQDLLLPTPTYHQSGHKFHYSTPVLFYSS